MFTCLRRLTVMFAVISLLRAGVPAAGDAVLDTLTGWVPTEKYVYWEPLGTGKCYFGQSFRTPDSTNIVLNRVETYFMVEPTDNSIPGYVHAPITGQLSIYAWSTDHVVGAVLATSPSFTVLDNNAWNLFSIPIQVTLAPNTDYIAVFTNLSGGAGSQSFRFDNPYLTGQFYYHTNSNSLTQPWSQIGFQLQSPDMALRMTFTPAPVPASAMIDTLSDWNGTDIFNYWVPYGQGAAHYGQSFITPSGTNISLHSVETVFQVENTVPFNNMYVPTPISVRLRIYLWSVDHTIGSPVYTSDLLTVPVNSTYNPITFNVSGLTLDPEFSYIADWTNESGGVGRQAGRRNSGGIYSDGNWYFTDSVFSDGDTILPNWLQYGGVPIAQPLQGIDAAFVMTFYPMAAPKMLSLNPILLAGDNSGTGTLTLNMSSITDKVVPLSNSDTTSATIPATVTVPAGQTTVQFPVSTSNVLSVKSVNFTATLNGISRMATLTVNPVIPATLMLTPSILSGGNSGTGTVTLNYASNTDKSVSLSSSDTVTASVPATVTVPAGQTTAQFPVTTFSVLILKNVNITATLNSISIQSAVFVTPIKLVSVTTSPTSVIGGKSSTGKVTLSAVAPVGGYVVNLSSSNPSAASVPASVTVIAGVKTATFAITTTPVVSLTKPVITGSFGGGSKSATLSITPPALSSIKLSASSVIGGVTATGTATLTGKAPTGGIVVALNSDTPSIATTPASVTILAGSLSAAFPITTVPVPVNSTVGIHGVYNAVDKSVTLTVKAPVVSALSLKPTTVHGGSQNSVGTVTLTGNASVGGFTVNLSSSNTSAATVPANVTILAGQKKATFTVTTLTVGIQTKPIITATTGIVSKSATLTVNP